MEIKKRIFDRKEFMNRFFNNEQALEKELGGIPIRGEINEKVVIQEYLPVVEHEYYIDVWDCCSRFAKRILKDKGVQETQLIELKSEKAKKLFEQLCVKRDIIINMSGHYYIKTNEQKAILDKILSIEGLR